MYTNQIICFDKSSRYPIQASEFIICNQLFIVLFLSHSNYYSNDLIILTLENQTVELLYILTLVKYVYFVHYSLEKHVNSEWISTQDKA